MGEPVIPAFLNPQHEAFNSELLLRLLNEGDVFDIELKPKNNDRLLLSFYVSNTMYAGGSNQKDYGFKYDRGKWKAHPFDPFEWERKHDEEKEGKIENALQGS